MKWTEDIRRKQDLAQELFYLLGAAGLKVKNVTYGIEDREEVYTVQMKNGTNYRINVTCDRPITAAYDVINFMQYKWEGNTVDDTKQNVFEIFNEMKNTSFRTLEDAVEEYGMVYVFNCWLRYEGIVGYTRDILSVLDAVGFDMTTEEDQ